MLLPFKRLSYCIVAIYSISTGKNAAQAFAANRTPTVGFYLIIKDADCKRISAKLICYLAGSGEKPDIFHKIIDFGKSSQINSV